MKRVAREVRQTVIMLATMAILIFLIWLLSHMGGILTWLGANWFPFGAGFVIALVGKAIINAIFNREDEKEVRKDTTKK